jgi:hypothetical protein
MKQYQYDFVISKICRELNISGSEKKFAFDVFINRISENLKYEETIKIPKIGFFQLKKGKNDDKEAAEQNDILVFVPFNSLSESEEFAFINIPIKKKENALSSSVDEYFSLSINKPILSINSSNLDNKNFGNSLFVLQKNLEDTINELIKTSDFLDGLNLWEDFVTNDNVDLVEGDFTTENIEDTMIEKRLLPSLDIDLEAKEENKTELIDVSDWTKDVLSIDSEESEQNSETPFLDENLFSDDTIEAEESFEITEDKKDIPEQKNIDDNLDEFDFKVSDDLELPDLGNNFDKDILNSFDDVKSKFEDAKQPEIIENIEEKKSDTDWTKELEEELFSTDIPDEQIDISEIKESLDWKEQNEEIINELVDLTDEVDAIGESSTETGLIDIETNNNNQDESLNTNLEIGGEKKDESDIDNLFESLIDTKEDPQTKPKKKLNLKKIALLIGVIFLILAIAGGTYYFFFNKTNKQSKNHEKVIQKENKNTEVKKTNEIIKEDQKILNNDSLSAEVKTEKSKIAGEENINTTKKTEDGKAKETLSKNESINKKLVENTEPVKIINGDLYKTGIEDKQIAEKIFFDGKKFNVQTSSWNSKSQAELAAKRLRGRGINAFIVKVDLKSLGIWYRIKIFDFNSKTEAEAYIKKNNL